MTDDEASAIGSVFEGRLECLRLFAAVRNMIEAMGPVKLSVARTQVAFGVRRQFAWVWLPQRWTKNRPANSIVLSFGLDRQIRDRRIVEAVEARPGRWTHHVIIGAESDLDAEVSRWLQEAYAFGSRNLKIGRRMKRTG